MMLTGPTPFGPDPGSKRGRSRACDRLLKSDVKYHFVIDMASLKK